MRRETVLKINKEYNTWEPIVKWIVYAELFLLIMGFLFFDFFKGEIWSFSFVVGGLVVFLNFLVLARTVPNLVLSRDVKASVFSLLFSFYSRLIFTGIVLVICIVFLRIPIYPLILGLSTIVVGIILWIGRYIILNNNQKEAYSHVRSSSSRIAS